MKYLVLACCLMASPVWATGYGAKVTEKTTCTLTEAVSGFSKYKDQDITTAVKVEKVCQKKGCWMQVTDGHQSLRVTFKDYGFFVPQDLDGKQVRMTGRLHRKEVSVEEQRHYLEDEGASKEVIAKVTKPSWEYRFVATGVATK